MASDAAKAVIYVTLNYKFKTNKVMHQSLTQISCISVFFSHLVHDKIMIIYTYKLVYVVTVFYNKIRILSSLINIVS